MRSALERYTTGVPPADSVARTQTQLPVRFRRHVALGSRPAPNAIQPGTPSSEQPGHAGLRNRSRSSAGHLPTTHRRRSRTQASATRHVGRPSLSVEMLPHVRRAAARRFSTSGFSAERVGPPHACGRRCQCATAHRQCGEDATYADRSDLEACRSRAGPRLVSSIWARFSSDASGQGRGSCGRPRGGRSASPLHRIGLRLLLNLLNGDISAAWEATTGDAFSEYF